MPPPDIAQDTVAGPRASARHGSASVWPIVTAALALAAMVALTAVTVVALGYLRPATTWAFAAATAGLWVLFAATVLLLRRVPARAAAAIVLAGSVALGAAGMAGPPDTSTDSARYAWDGIVQNAGISPYAHVPASDALASLRPDWLFPEPVRHADGTLHCPEPRTHLIATTPSDARVCTAINRASVPTIYPGGAELVFAGVRAITGPGPAYWPLQLLGLLLSVGVTVLLLAGLRRRGLDPRLAALWALCPLTIAEAVTNSHIDVLGALLALAAAFLVSAGARFRGGIAIGAAAAVKLIPVLALPALLRRQPWKVLVAAAVTFAVLCLPYLLVSGSAVIGYLPGYVSEEGYDNGTRSVLLTAILPKTWTTPVAAVLILGVAVLVMRFTDPRRPWLGQSALIGTTLVLLSPGYPWYALLLVPFVAMSGRWEWLLVGLALEVHAILPAAWVFRVALLVAVAAVVTLWAVRRSRNGLRMRAGMPQA